MLVYTATKKDFVSDTRTSQIDDKIRVAFKRYTNQSVAPSEINAWRNSMQFMANVLERDDIPADAGVSIEYQLPLSRKRIDFILTGKSAETSTKPSVETAVIIELKQWSKVEATDKRDVVRTVLGGSEIETPHPSYQAWSYASVIQEFNETVRLEKIALQPCAYLHNLDDKRVINDPRYSEVTQKAPAFFKNDIERLASFLKQHVKYGDTGNIMYRIEHGRIRPSKNLADSLASMIKGNVEFTLLDEQKLVYETALQLAHLANRTGKKQVLIVEGGPGTGKSVVAINLLVELTKAEILCQYVSKNAAPRAVYADVLAGTKTKAVIGNLFKGSGGFIETETDTFGALLIDEAHRLNEKSGLYGNKGENQIKELIAAAQLSVFFIDEDQWVTLKDIGTRVEIERWAKALDAKVHRQKLLSQFRCNGSDAYLAWLDNTLQKRETANPSLTKDEFEFQVFDDPNALRKAIETKNRDRNKARLVAGYCWDWKSKSDSQAMDIVIEPHQFSARWNLESDGSLWAIAEKSVSEIGCIHTSQGLELDYVGVIVGPDLIVRNGRVICDASMRSKNDQSVRGYKKLLETKSEVGIAKLDAIIKNTYRTLMTRAQKGCYIYCTDNETSAWFKQALSDFIVEQPLQVQVDNLTMPTATYPFRVLSSAEARMNSNAVALFDIKIAAGSFSFEQNVQGNQWAELPDQFNMQEGLFIAQVVGESMNRSIPNGSWCLFRANPAGTRQGKIVLVEHRDIADIDTGGHYTIKRYSSQKHPAGDDQWQHETVWLKPESSDPKYETIEITVEDEGQFRVLGQYLATLAAD